MGLLLLVQQTSDSHSRKSTWWVVLDPKTEVAKWNSAIIHFIIYTCASPTVTCKNASENSLLWLCINMLLTWCCQPPVCRLLLAPNHSTGLWRLYKTCTWQTHKHSNPHHMTYWSIVCVFLDVCQMCDNFNVRASNILFASSMSFTARQWHFHHTGGESNPQSVTLAVYLHADDAFVFHTINTAPREEWITGYSVFIFN